MMEPLCIGQRIRVHTNHTATVRYVGEVDGHPGDVWVGVEWDDPSRGKHDGSLDGRRYFVCRFDQQHPASLIKMARLLASASMGLNIADAMRQRYMCPASRKTPGVDVAAAHITWDSLLSQDKIALAGLDVSDVVRST